MAGTGAGDLMLEAVDIVHSYGTVTAVDHVSLETKRGEFLTILGESGSGKTTMLRIISGLEIPTSAARLAIAGVDVRHLPAAQRDCTTVFQNYALFPHMSVGENVGYGLRLRRVPRDEAARQIEAALAMVRLHGKAERRIAQLSGGERQRVALARALVTRPAILLLDEPLGALDERLRFDMQAELVEIHRTLGTTFINITHSQEEALTMSDRIVLMRKGRVEQSGSPESLFDRPVSRFAAEFMGFENLLPGTIVSGGPDGRVRVALSHGVDVEGVWNAAGEAAPGTSVSVAIRSERLSPRTDGSAEPGTNLIACRPTGHLYRGKYTDLSAETAAGPLKLRSWERHQGSGDFGWAACRAEDCVVLTQ